MKTKPETEDLRHASLEENGRNIYAQNLKLLYCMVPGKSMLKNKSDGIDLKCAPLKKFNDHNLYSLETTSLYEEKTISFIWCTAHDPG